MTRSALISRAMRRSTTAKLARDAGKKSINRKSVIGFLVFCTALAFLGGASRPDEIANALLRPIGIGIGVFVLWFWQDGQIDRGRPILVGLLGLVVICALQLIPLPPSIWTSLPGRDVILAVDQLLFEGQVWRPLTVSPGGTWNTLFNVLGLIGGFLAFLALGRRHDVLVLRAILIIAAISALLGLIQAQSGTEVLPFYAKTSNGPTGLFSNANHFGIFCGIGMLVAADLANRAQLFGPRQARWFIFAAIAVLMLAGSLISSSRLAFGSATLAVICSAVIFAKESSLFTAPRTRNTRAAIGVYRKAAAAGFAIAIMGMAAFFIHFSLLQREAGMGTFEEVGLAENLRFIITPVLLSIASQQWLFGVGFGSFSDFYAIVEPAGMMGPQYVNHAHNDFLQILIEGGAAAAAIAMALLAWIIWRLFGLFRRGDAVSGVLVAGMIGIIGFSSAFDYVLRAPLMAFVVACLATIWASRANEERS